MPKAMDTMGFLDSFAKAVLPYLRPYPQPNSILICDNATLHHDQQGLLEKLVESVGAKLFYLPPYACDLNPIEKARCPSNAFPSPPHRPSAPRLIHPCVRKAFGSIKRIVQRESERAAFAPWEVLNEAFDSIGPDLALKYCDNMMKRLEAC